MCWCNIQKATPIIYNDLISFFYVEDQINLYINICIRERRKREARAWRFVKKEK